MSRGISTLMAFTMLVTLAAAERLSAQDEHEQLRLQMAATHSQAVALFQQINASPSVQAQQGAALHTMQGLLDQLGVLLAASACNPKQYARINQRLLVMWHGVAGASNASAADSDRLQALYGLLQQEQGTIQQLADFHARQEAAVQR